MNIHNPEEFAKAYTELDATDEPEAIRNLIDEDQQKELRQSKSGKWYSVENGELKQVEA